MNPISSEPTGEDPRKLRPESNTSKGIWRRMIPQERTWLTSSLAFILSLPLSLLNKESIASRETPLVSGTTYNDQKNAAMQLIEKRRNVALRKQESLHSLNTHCKSEKKHTLARRR